MRKFLIPHVSSNIDVDLKKKIDGKTKPPGSLGRLETLALQCGKIQDSLNPELVNPTILVFAGDHGVTEEGVSPYPQEVTAQMVLNFLNGGAAINVFCRQNNISLHVVDAGVKTDFPEGTELINANIGRGTKNFCKEAAMSLEECERAIENGAELSRTVPVSTCNVIGFGEMGIGNTSSAAALTQRFTGLPVEDCVGKGTGLDDSGLEQKQNTIRQALEKHAEIKEPQAVLSTFGGFEIAMMVGAMLESAVLKRIILIDGFIASAAFLAASRIVPEIKQYAVFTHKSNEQGHAEIIKYLEVEPLISLGMCLGEGTGAAVAFPILKSAVSFLNQMASFESAGVSGRIDVKKA
ncbi:MAG: nicotinate-nucleotide--dimethylbenzimidazole phosphoribosyltransferase [SAR324 cluster bacterium]|jgi:nicotinate-nucleotide--dimethylbenzimidazole phosphoribosyltransferase|nr:nicotinate-nucleotide--dimethylbenzimidazole phosphoribosyltransferase [SAR324 cluster bacterium]